MTSPKDPKKGIRFPRKWDHTKDFLKDWERLARTGRYSMNRLRELMILLIDGDSPLGPEWLDHPLKGNWAGYRECHIGGDFLLIYRIEYHKFFDEIIFVRTGSHADLFEN